MDGLPRMLEQLEEYTKVHFATEESMLRQCGYDRYEEHKDRHDWMVQKTIELRVNYRVRNENLSSEMLSLLKDWWIGHIQKIDRQYVAALIAAPGSNSA
jgi:hemerythrin